MASVQQVAVSALLFAICRGTFAEASAECTWPVDISLSGTLDNGEAYLTRFAFRERLEPDLLSVTETTDVDIARMQVSFGSQVQASTSWGQLMARRSCSLGIDNPSFALLPSPPRAIGRIRVTARKYVCALRTKTRIASANITSTIPFSVEHEGDQITIVTGQVLTQTDTSWEQRAVLDLVGASLLGIGGAVGTDYLQNSLLRAIRSRISTGFGANSVPNASSPTSSMPDVPGYAPELIDTSFVDLGAGKLGVRLVRMQQKIRKGTACFLADALKRKAAASTHRSGTPALLGRYGNASAQ